MAKAEKAIVEDKTNTETAAEAPAPVAAVVPLETRSQRSIMDGGGRFHEASFHHARHSAHPVEGTKFENILSDSYWSHVAAKINAGDIIEVRPEEGDYYAELYVQVKVGNNIKVHCIRKDDLPPIDQASNADDYVVAHRGTHRQWCVVRKKDNAIIAEGFKTQGEAFLAVPRRAAR